MWPGRSWHLTRLTIAVSVIFGAAFCVWAVVMARQAAQISGIAAQTRAGWVPMILERQAAVVKLQQVKQDGMAMRLSGDPARRAAALNHIVRLAGDSGFAFDGEARALVGRCAEILTAMAHDRDEADRLRAADKPAAADALEERVTTAWRAAETALDGQSDALAQSVAELTRQSAVAVETLTDRVRALVVVGLSGALLLLGVAAVIVHQVLLRPIQRTTRALAADRAGPPLPLPSSRIREIDLLYRSTERMAAVVAEAEEASRQARAAQADLRRLASTDALTGLANRRWFFEMAGRELERCRRFRHPFSVMMVDADHFKAVNDTYGHAVGDIVLVALARALESTLRSIDLVGRLGGEEFAVGLPQTVIGDAASTGERLRAAVEAIEVPVEGGGRLKITVSVGVAVIEDSEEPLDVLLARADEALYAAKRDGRNRVVVS